MKFKLLSILFISIICVSCNTNLGIDAANESESKCEAKFSRNSNFKKQCLKGVNYGFIGFRNITCKDNLSNCYMNAMVRCGNVQIENMTPAERACKDGLDFFLKAAMKKSHIKELNNLHFQVGSVDYLQRNAPEVFDGIRDDNMKPNDSFRVEEVTSQTREL